MMASSTQQQQIAQFLTALAAKQSTPGGGAAAAVGAAVGAAAASMAAAYTQRRQDQASGAAAKATTLIGTLNVERAMQLADADAVAYADLQKTWKKDSNFTAEERRAIEQRALAVPVSLVELCHEYCVAIHTFLPDCNKNITSDAKVGIHQLSGAARAAYQTVLVNSPPHDEKQRLKAMLLEMRRMEDELLEME